VVRTTASSRATAAAGLAACTLLTVPARAAAADPARAELTDFRWSDDGTKLVVAERTAGAFGALRVYDGETGALESTLAGETISAACAASNEAGLALQAVGPAARRVLLRCGARPELWTRADGSLESPKALAGLQTRPSFAPLEDRIAYVRGGDLWTLDLVDSKERRLTSAPGVEGLLPAASAGPLPDGSAAGFAWSPNGESIAYLQSPVDGSIRAAVVDLVDAAPRRLELPDGEQPQRLRWRPDGRAIVVETVSSAGSSRVFFCHPEKSYCRRLVERPWTPGGRTPDALRFFDDGFVWGGPRDASPSLDFYDTLGRDRRRLLDGSAERLAGVVAVFPLTAEAVVAVTTPEDPGTVRLELIRVHSGSRTEIARGALWPIAQISETERAWVRPSKGPEGTFDGYVLEGLDGTTLRRFSLDGRSSAAAAAP